jgi:hypothetical protein
MGRDVHVRITDAAARIAILVERHPRPVAVGIAFANDSVSTGRHRPTVDPLPEMVEGHRHVRAEREPADGKPAWIEWRITGIC